MRYRIKGVELRSENAAKSHMQRSKAVVEYLRATGRVKNLLDFGCGKLRYADQISKLGKHVVFVDSHVQLTRNQRVQGRVTTVASLARERYSNASVLPSEKLVTARTQHDLITCINVLSAIPDILALRGVLRTIRRLTKPTGIAVFINQHRNTYFSRFSTGRRHLFGYIFEGRNGPSYYGVMTREG